MRTTSFLLALILLATTSPAGAQLALPGAVNASTPQGAEAPPAASALNPKNGSNQPYGSQPMIVKPPGEATILGQTLSLDGQKGALAIEKSGERLQIVRLTLVGEQISHPNQSCQINIAAERPIALKPLGQPDGLWRYRLEAPACPFTLDVLDGAILAASPGGACSFQQADCRVNPAGLWGPASDSFGPKRIAAIERERSAMENSTRANFRLLSEKFHGNRDAARAAVIEQAAFSSRREEMCRDYDQEGAHGFCALRVTEARNFLLRQRLTSMKSSREGNQSEKDKRQRTLVAPPKGSLAPM